MTKDVLKYLQPNAVIPIDMETTTALVNALKERLAQPEQEPMAWIHIDPDKPKVKFLEWKENEHGYRGRWIKKPLYLHPPQRTEQEPFAIVHIKDGCLVGSHRDQNKLFPDGQYGLWPVATPPAQPPQRIEQKFCSRCGKRTKDLITIHTCTPPKD